MLFTEPTFLFLFLPILLGLYFAQRGVHGAYGNWLLLVASVVFYATGGGSFTWLMLGSIAFNYWMAIAVDRARGTARAKRHLAFAVGVNLVVLGVFKYANFFVDNVNALSSAVGGAAKLIDVPRVLLPIGISFFTFHAISYVVDVYRRDATAQKSPVHAALYLLLFPQLIAGPIIRYRDIADQLARRLVTRDDFADGIRRFVVGLAKKVLVANVVAGPADRVFAMPFAQLSAAHAWLGIVCYTFQIYFDFSGYSDMAIGLGRMFGFRFPENFRWPYIARSVQEFWRRWHISLSTWFRDYLYIPLGGNRVPPASAVSQSRARVLPLRALARRELELRRVGSVARRVSGHRTRGGAAREHIAPVPIARDRVADLGSRLRHARRHDRLGILPRRNADCRGRLPWIARRPESRAADRVHGRVLADAGGLACARRWRDRIDAVGAVAGGVTSRAHPTPLAIEAWRGSAR